MKIAMIGHKRIPSREGGVEIVVEELSTRMAALGHDVTVYNRSGHNVSGRENDGYSYQKRFEYEGVHVVTVPAPQKKSLNAIVYSFLATLRACMQPYDVIHFHAEGPCVMIPLAKLFGKRCVATIHGLDWKRSKWGGFATKFLLFGEKTAARHADAIIVLSSNVKEYFLDTYGRNTFYIPNGINIPERQHAKLITEKYGLRGEDYILFLARIVPEKGLHYLMEAYHRMNTNKKLVIAGGSSHTDEYMEQIRHMAEEDDRVILTGFVQGRMLEELYSNCYVYVLPSDIEGMPISLLEALSYGKRCLVSDILENTEVTGTLADTFHHGDSHDLQEHLEHILANPDMIPEADTIRTYIQDRYDWNIVVKETLMLY